MYFAECVKRVTLIVCIFRVCRQGLLLNNCLYVFVSTRFLVVCMYITECVDNVYLLSVCVLPSVPTRFTHCLYVFYKVCR